MDSGLDFARGCAVLVALALCSGLYTLNLYPFSHFPLVQQITSLNDRIRITLQHTITVSRYYTAFIGPPGSVRRARADARPRRAAIPEAAAARYARGHARLRHNT